MQSVLFGICGPTASGKSAIALALCEELGGEILSADSMQVYTGMDILSAQPTQSERQRVRHHMVAVASPAKRFNATMYRDEATKALEDIYKRGALPILCGGSGLYIDALTKDISMASQADLSYREELKRIAALPEGPLLLHRELMQKDPESARKYPPGDVRRVIRSLEIFAATGKPRGEAEKQDAMRPDRIPCKLYALKWDRAALYQRIERRVEEMLSMGLVEEVRRLMQSSASVQETALQAIGFKEMRAHLLGEIGFDEAVDRIKQATRRLAKRQETWFKRDPRVTWLATDGHNMDEITRQIKSDIVSRR